VRWGPHELPERGLIGPDRLVRRDGAVGFGDSVLTVSATASGDRTGYAQTKFSVVLTGGDGFSSDQARSFAPAPQPYQFGDSRPICSVDPATVPKAMDVITPSGVSQASELNPLNGPVVIQGVTLP
jgi:glucoamylase